MNCKKIVKPVYIIFLGLIILVLISRVFIGEISIVPSDSMNPTILTGDWLWLDKFTYGTRMPVRWADIPLVNVFTWKEAWRDKDAKQDWGYRRFAGIRSPQINDIIVFYSKENPEMMLVKRVASILPKNKTIQIMPDNYNLIGSIVKLDGKSFFQKQNHIYINGICQTRYAPCQNYYYVLGDNSANSCDSRFFGYIPESAIVGRMNIVLFSFDSNQYGWSKFRWNRVFKNIE